MDRYPRRGAVVLGWGRMGPFCVCVEAMAGRVLFVRGGGTSTDGGEEREKMDDGAGVNKLSLSTLLVV